MMGLKDRDAQGGNDGGAGGAPVRGNPCPGPLRPIRVAATTQETYPMVGRMGYPIFIAVRTTSIADLKRFIGGHHEARRAAGPPGPGPLWPDASLSGSAAARPRPEEPRSPTGASFPTISDAPPHTAP